MVLTAYRWLYRALRFATSWDNEPFWFVCNFNLHLASFLVIWIQLILILVLKLSLSHSNASCSFFTERWCLTVIHWAPLWNAFTLILLLLPWGVGRYFWINLHMLFQLMQWQFELELGSLLRLYHALHAFGLVDEPILAIDALHPTAKHTSWSFTRLVVGILMKVLCWIDGKFQIWEVGWITEVTYRRYTL